MIGLTRVASAAKERALEKKGYVTSDVESSDEGVAKKVKKYYKKAAKKKTTKKKAAKKKAS